MTEETRNARLARIYVERSSSQDLAAILPMLDADAEYRSTRVGNHRGRDAIGAMMGGFFAGYPDVAWRVAEYEVLASTPSSSISLCAPPTPRAARRSSARGASESSSPTKA